MIRFKNLSLQVLRQNKYFFNAYSVQTYSKRLRVNVCNTLTEFLNKGEMCNDKWMELRKRLLDEKTVNDKNIDISVYDICESLHRMDAALSYINYLISNDFGLNAAIAFKYLVNLCRTETQLSEADRKIVLSIYNTYRKELSEMNEYTMRCCIVAACLMNKWQEVSILLTAYDMSYEFNKKIYISLIITALKKNKINIVLQYLNNKNISKKLCQETDVINVYLSYYSKMEKLKFDAAVEHLFEFWVKYLIIPSKSKLDICIENCKKHNWVAVDTSIKKDGTCSSCSHMLQDSISKENFKKLSTAIMQNVIIGTDIYLQSFPDEVKHFQNFVNKTKPFDIILDGLNILYAKKLGSGGNEASLLSVISYFQKQGKKILVLGRKHMLKNSFYQKLQREGQFYAIADMSLDDPFLLYATLQSGSHAKFVSKDLMRQHKSTIGDHNMQNLFKAWQIMHQYRFELSKGKLTIKEPPNFISRVYKDQNGWHIPYTLAKRPFDNYDIPETWVCLRREM